MKDFSLSDCAMSALSSSRYVCDALADYNSVTGSIESGRLWKQAHDLLLEVQKLPECVSLIHGMRELRNSK
jgi:hypothetical protein